MIVDQVKSSFHYFRSMLMVGMKRANNRPKYELGKSLTTLFYFFLTDTGEIFSRVSKYLSSAGNVVHIPVAEAMVMCKGKG